MDRFQQCVSRKNQHVVVFKKDPLLSLAKSSSYHVVLGNLLYRAEIFSFEDQDNYGDEI